MTYTIYALSEMADGPVRYIGVTGGPMEARVTKHLGKARRATVPSPFHAWLLTCGRPVVRALATGETLPEAQDAERQAIDDARMAGADLFNKWRGGALQAGITRRDATRQKIGTASRERWATRRDAIIAAQQAGKARADASERMGAAIREVWERPGMLRHQSLAHATRLTEEDVRQIKQLIVAGERNASITRLFKLSQHHVAAIRAGRIWRHVTIQAA